MGKIKRFEIFYASESGAFYAGQAITGKVVVELKEPVKIKAVKMRCQGELYVNFNDLKSKKRHTERHSYFDHGDTIFAGAEEPIPAGVHEYPFSFSFNNPHMLPSSFESQYGHVRYSCTANLHLPLLTRDQSARKPFSLVSVVDLNSEPLAFTPGYRHKECRFSLADQLLCCVAGGLSARLKIDKSAYVPGEMMLLHAEVNNNSSKKVKKVEAYIQQNVIYSTAKGGKRFVKGDKKIALITQSSVKRGDAQIWNEPITVPPLPPSKLGGCQQIAVDYLLSFVISVEKSDDILLNIPLVIGTVPVHQAPLEWLPNTSRSTTTASAAPAATPVAAGHRQLPTVPSPPVAQRQPSAPPIESGDYLGPPPTYEECVYSDGVSPENGQVPTSDRSEVEDETDGNGKQPYRPLYPTYATLGRPGTSFTMLAVD